MRGIVAAVGVILIAGRAAVAQLPDTYFDERSEPAVAYSSQQPNDPIAQLNRKLVDGQIQLAFNPRTGYLRSVLDMLNVPTESQLAVFSKTSVQARLISPTNPRTLFFNDAVAVAWPRGGFIEAAAQDPQLGVIFYVLNQEERPTPQFVRTQSCTVCHQSSETLSVPGMLLRSAPTRADGQAMPQLGNYTTDHRSPFSERWGGWYVTGRSAGVSHLGNALVEASNNPQPPAHLDPPNLSTLTSWFDTEAYLSPYSDIVALMVFDHQVHMSNLLTRMSWEVRSAKGGGDDALLRDIAREVVDYLLFVDEAPLPGPVKGSSGFAERFAAQGPRDQRGRSLRELDLQHRLLRYPCSYTIYSDAFEGLPTDARAAIYRRMWEVLSGQETAPKYERLTAADRRAVLEILRDTKPALPDYFRASP